MFETFLTALPAAAASPYALIAYLILIAAATYISIAQFRLRTIAKVIEAVPADERASLLAREYNVTPRAGLSPAQWIRARRHMLVFWFLMTIVAGILIVVIIAIKEAAILSNLESGRQDRLVALWEGEQRRLELLLKSGALSQESYSAIVVSLNSLSIKLSDPKAATKAFGEVAKQVQESLYRERSPLSADKIDEANKALSKGAPSVVKAILKEAAIKDMSHAADKYYQIGKLSEQEADFLEADSAYKNAVDIDPSNIKYLEAYQSSQLLLGQYANSELLLRRLTEMEEASHSLGTNNRSEELDLKLAFIYLVQSRFNDAEPIYVNAKQRMERDQQTKSFAFGILLNNLGSLYHNWGRYNEANALLRAALPILITQVGQDDPEVAKIINNLGYLSTLRAELSEVQALLQESIRIFVLKYGPRNAQLLNPLNNFARYYTRKKKYNDAEGALSEAFSIGSDKFGGKHPWIGRTYDLLSVLKMNLGFNSEACEASAKALEIKRLFYGEQPSLEIAHSLSLRGRCHLKSGELVMAERDLAEARKVIRDIAGPKSVLVAEIDASLGELCRRKGNVPDALRYYTAASEVMNSELGMFHPTSQDIAQAVQNLKENGHISEKH